MNNDGVITSYTYDKNNRLLTEGDIVYTYDANGNTLTAGDKTYTYNYRGQQVAYSDGTVTASYAYNPSGLRSAKTVGGSTKYFVYNGMQIVFEYEDSVSVGTTYYYGLNRTHSSDGDVFVYNAHGDTVQLVNDNALAASYTYDAFGNLLTSAGTSDNPFLYCSEYFDAETETYYLRARYYNPANGRFTQQDAWAFMDASDPLSLNLYTYCANNPVMYVDPSGYDPIGLRDMVNSLGGKIEWNSETSTATVTIGEQTIEYQNSFAGQDISYRMKLDAIETGAVSAYIDTNSKMYVDELQFYEDFGIITYEYSVDDIGGTVFFATPNVTQNGLSLTLGTNDFWIIDYRRRAGNNPAVEVLACYNSVSKNQRFSVIDILLAFEAKDPTDWNRSRGSLESEWWYHSFFSDWPIIGARGKDAMLDNNGGN